MCLRSLVLVTLALIWTSAIVLGAPRSESPYALSQLDPERIKEIKHDYALKPSTPTCVWFKILGEERKSARRVQQWKGIPDFLAWAISTSSRQRITIPYTEEQVTVVVTAYVTPPDTDSYPPESMERTITPYFDGGPGIETYPILHVAPIDAQGWDLGTAVWAHILHSLGAVATPISSRHSSLILAIAWANPRLSRMLYFKLDPETNTSLGYLLLSIAQKQALTHEERETLVQVVTPKRPKGGSHPHGDQTQRGRVGT